jgi:flagellar motor switch protein FliM
MTDEELTQTETPSDAPATEDEEKLMAQWAALADGEGEGEEAAALERTLNQDEIDSLFGVSSSQSGMQNALQFLINNSKITHDRLPMLEIIFDRLVRLLTTSLRNYANTTVEANLETITSVRFGDYLEQIPLPALISVYKAIEWSSHSLIVVETSLIYALMDILLGGRHEAVSGKIEGRPFSSIERNLVKDLVKIVLTDFSQAFSTVTPVQFEHERTEVNPRFAAIVRNIDTAILISVRLIFDNRGGCIEFCIPYGSIEPVRDQIVQMFTGEKFGQDNIWPTHLEHELWDSEITLDVLLADLVLPLQDVLSWQVGSSLPLRVKPTSKLPILIGEMPVSSGYMGQRDGVISMKIDENYIREKVKRNAA